MISPILVLSLFEPILLTGSFRKAFKWPTQDQRFYKSLDRFCEPDFRGPADTRLFYELVQ